MSIAFAFLSGACAIMSFLGERRTFVPAAGVFMALAVITL